MKAQLIGESSAGMTAVHILDNDGTIVWATRWFDNGATAAGYLQGLKDAFDCMYYCNDYEQFDGCSIDDDGDVVDFDDSETTGIVLEYDGSTKEWMFGDNPSMGEGREIVDACILAGLIGPDGHHDEYYDGSKTTEMIADHITSVINND